MQGHPVCISRVHGGVGYARNMGVELASDGLLVFLDDDLILDPQITKYILNVNPGEFAMTFLEGFPCTRVFVIYKKDFLCVGKFDERIRFTGEDRDFYVRAIDYGLRFKQIPIGLVRHIPHPIRARNIHVAVQSVKENVVFMRKYWRSHPEVFKIDVLYRLKRGQLRTLLLEAFWFFYLTVKGENKN